MSQDPSRRSRRIPYVARLMVRGACGVFAAVGIDVSRTGIRLAMAPEALRMDPEADLAAAAACIQTRVGSRFSLDLGLTAAGRGRVRKHAELVRLVVDGEEGGLELGCRFPEPLSTQELRELKIDVEDVIGTDEDEIRRAESWTEGGRPALDPKLAEEKVENLLGVPVASPRGRNERRPERELRALVRGEGEAPLVGTADGFTDATMRVRITEDEVRRFGAEPGDFTALARAMEAAYGSWPVVEILEGTRRVWHGTAHPCGLEVAGSGDRGAIVRMAFGRRLQPSELERLCA